LSDTKRQVINL